MVDFGQFFRFESGRLISVSDGAEVVMAAADSFLVNQGRVRSLQAHYQRFAGWVTEAAPEIVPALPEFFAAVSAALPHDGRWFPRIELRTEGGVNQLFLRLRLAPETMDDVVLWTYPEPDPRLSPTVKGPDLSLCMQLRRMAQVHGATETVLTDRDGFLSECALSSLVWWRGDVLCAPSHETAWLDGITRTEVLSIAAQMQIETRLEKVRPHEIAGLELWLLSSLQGIKPVSGWVGQDRQPAAPGRQFEAFSKRLRLLETAVA